MGKRTEEVAIQISKFRSRSPPITVIIDAHLTNYSENSWSKALGLHRSGLGWVGFSRGLDFKAVSFVLRAKSDHAALTPTCQPRGVGE